MNKKIIFLPFYLFTFSLFFACQSKTEMQPALQPTDTVAVKPAKTPSQQQALNYSTASKGKIEAVREIPVFSRLAEQIVMFGIEKTGQHVKKGQVVARLSDATLREKILHSRAKLEKAEFQYQAILMGQGYKHDHLDAAPEKIKQLARINSGYNEAKAELHELEHQLSYCVITAPVSGAVSQIKNTLYGAALPGEALFYIVDTEHLKVSFDVLENELAKYQMGASLSVSTVAYPAELHSATVSAISPVIDGNGMVHIEATLAPHPHLMPGMTAFITIVK
ncbi:MAG: HlyD family efflux transporter periplasmic adaptor subunit [Prevotella sp.]|nr:HlyD family efflux transporter periplasmic adaptor subunit [Prevotella sp.]